jgi:hypothetical protein
MKANKLLVAAVLVASAILVTVSVPRPLTSAAEADWASLKSPETYPSAGAPAHRRPRAFPLKLDAVSEEVQKGAAYG